MKPPLKANKNQLILAADAAKIELPHPFECGGKER